MGVQIGGGSQANIRPDDFQQTVEGITYAVKFINIPAIGGTTVGIYELIDGDWILAGGNYLSTNVEGAIQMAGGEQAYVDQSLRPAVAAWLAQRKLQQPTPVDRAAIIVGKWLPL